MIRNYFKSALRNLLRQKVSSLINIFCMSVAVGCSIVAYLFIEGKINREWMHANGENIFLIQYEAHENGNVYTYGNTPVPLGPAIETDLTQVVRAVRVSNKGVKVHSRDQEFDELVRLVDPAFMEMFTFPLKYGDAKALYEKNAIILSEDAAKKYFGEENPLGRTLPMTWQGKEERLFTVRGVAEPFPSRSCVAFELLVSYENRYEDLKDLNNWNAFTSATFIQVDQPGDINEVSSLMSKYVALQNSADTVNRPIEKFGFGNLLDLKLKAGDIKNSIVGTLKPAPMVVLASISIFLLLLACFNFINISVAMAGSRVKEIGVRKVIGGNKSQLIFQFLSENILSCVLSFFLAIAITQGFLLPAFNSIAGTHLQMDFTSRMNLWMYLIVLLIFVGIISGIYPAFYISSFQPIAVLRDRLKFSAKSKFMQFLLTFQFVLAFITMISSVGLTLNAIDLRKRDWGYAKENVLVIKVKNTEQYNLMRKTATEQPNVLSIAGAKQHVGTDDYERDIKINDKKTFAVIFEVGSNYLETMGITLMEGKFPDSRDAVVVNETLAREWSGKNAMAQTIMVDTIAYSVAGVVKDFHNETFQGDIDPLMFRLGDESEFTHVVMRTEPETGIKTSTLLNETWKKFFPDVAFDHFFQDQTFDRMYRDTAGILQVFIFTTVIALLMSCVGLFGLASQRAMTKMKEVCVRKVFGIPVAKAILLVNGNFLILLVVAALIATPLSYFILNALLDSIYTYRMEVGASSFIISYLLILVTMVITLMAKIYEVAIANPAEILRNE